MEIGTPKATLIGPRFAFVVAAYNAERTLGPALDSVLGQPYGKWEVVVVDDGSTDQTLQVAQEYSQRDSRIRVVSQSNAGSGAARNAAIQLVEADFTAYLDADDLLAPDYCVEMLRLMDEFPGCDIYSSDGLYIYEDGSSALVFDYGTTVSLRIEDLIEDCRILGGGALVRTDVLRSLGGFREHMYGEDYDLWLRALAAGFSHVGSPKPLYIYHLCVSGQKSKDPEAGRTSAVNALADLIASGQLTPEQATQASESITRHRADAQLEVEAQALRASLERLLGPRLAGPALRALHTVSWIVRPLRRMLARAKMR